MSGWWYSVTDDSGTFIATISDNDGGGGGCFISTMNQ